MKILIFYASYGGGHFNAAKSINDYILKNYKNIDVELIDCMKYVNKTIERITTAAYTGMAKKAPWAWGKIYSDSKKGMIAHISNRTNEVLAIKLLKLLREKQPDLVISTHPFGGQMCSYLKRKGKITAKIATVMTDFSLHEQWIVGSDYIDYYFVSTDKMKQGLVERNVASKKIKVTGIPFSSKFLEPHNRKKILKNLNFDTDKKTILFFGGGEFGLGKAKTAQIFNNFVSNCNNVQIIAISGKNEKMHTAFANIISTNKNNNKFALFKYTNQVPEFMSISDLVVTKPGGLTTTESLVSGLPMIIINPIPGQEEENAEFLVKSNVAIWIKSPDEVPETLKKIFSDSNVLETMKQNAEKLAHVDSTQKICEILLENTDIQNVRI